MQHHILLSLILLSFGGPAYASPESTQLALALKQLDGVKNSLERARNSASADSQSRYFFDYLQAQPLPYPSKGAAACRPAPERQLPAREPR